MASDARRRQAWPRALRRRGPDTGHVVDLGRTASRPGPVTDSVTASTPEKSARRAATTRSSPGKTAHGTVSPGTSEYMRTWMPSRCMSVEEGARHNPRHAPLTHERRQSGPECRQAGAGVPSSRRTRTDAPRPGPSRRRPRGHAPSSRAASRRESEPGTAASWHHLAGRHARAKTLDRAVPDHPHVAFRDAQAPCPPRPPFSPHRRSGARPCVRDRRAGRGTSRGDRRRAWRLRRGLRPWSGTGRLRAASRAATPAASRSFAIVRLTPRTNDAI